MILDEFKPESILFFRGLLSKNEKERKKEKKK